MTATAKPWEPVSGMWRYHDVSGEWDAWGGRFARCSPEVIGRDELHIRLANGSLVIVKPKDK